MAVTDRCKPVGGQRCRHGAHLAQRGEGLCAAVEQPAAAAIQHGLAHVGSAERLLRHCAVALAKVAQGEAVARRTAVQQRRPARGEAAVEERQLLERRLGRAQHAPLVRVDEVLEHKGREAAADGVVFDHRLEEHPPALPQQVCRRVGPR